MAITISLKQRYEDNDELLFPEAAHLPAQERAEATDDAFWTEETEEGQLAVDVYETPLEIVLRSPIAGVDLADLEVSLHNDMLTVRGTRRTETETGARALVRECHWGSFSRSVILPTEIDGERISATLKDGILTVRMPKSERAKRIQVNGQ